MSFKVVATPYEQAASLLMRVRFVEEELTQDFSPDETLVEIPLAQTNLETVVLSLRWTDGSRSTFQVNLHEAFVEDTIQIHFNKPDGAAGLPPDVEVSNRCLGARPQTIPVAFSLYYTCRDFALKLEGRARKWEVPHRAAVEGWHIANRFLYDLATPLSPYGFDRELLRRLEEAVEGQDQDPGLNYSPLRLPDARVAIDLVASEGVRMAGFVPQFVSSGQLELASSLNDRALVDLRNLLADEEGAVFRINESLLMDNASYISSLLAVR